MGTGVLLILLLAVWLATALHIKMSHLFFVIVTACLAFNPDGTLSYPIINWVSQLSLIAYLILLFSAALFHLFKVQLPKDLAVAIIGQLNWIAIVLIGWTSVFISLEKGFNTTFFMYSAVFVTFISIGLFLVSTGVKIALIWLKRPKTI